MLSASVASQTVFMSTLKQRWAGGSWSRVKEGEMKMTQIVYVQPGSIYLAIGAKTSSVRNIVVYGTLVYVTGKIPVRQTWCFSAGEKVPVIHLLRPSSYTQLTLTDCLQPAPTGGGGGWLVRSSQHTEGVLHFPSLTTRKKTALTAGTV